MTNAADIEALLDAVAVAAQALAAADAAVSEASVARAAAEKTFLLKSRQLNELLAKVVNRAERGANWRDDGDGEFI